MKWEGFDDEGISRVINAKIDFDPCLGRNDGTNLNRSQLENDVRVGMYVRLSISMANVDSSHAAGDGVVVAVTDHPKGKRLKIRHTDNGFERGLRYTINVSTWNMNRDGVHRFSSSGARMKRVVSCAWDVKNILTNNQA